MSDESAEKAWQEYIGEQIMNDDDPELEEVRSWYVDGRRVHNPFASDAALVRRFDVWLSGVIREAKAEQREADARIAESEIPRYTPYPRRDVAAAIRAAGGNDER